MEFVRTGSTTRGYLDYVLGQVERALQMLIQLTCDMLNRGVDQLGSPGGSAPHAVEVICRCGSRKRVTL